ncbi:hypothetical protein PAHAL_4G121900 [Panicum hallii]|uniref:RING-type E3 ubiquitin transferase n=1 Tax=Panicum hallii TaxID=206008 RepID=A0A2S3HIW1_9POAL|nr:RING-H2 finger protein ATL39-like [Panicum hallii]PAN23833.1 hypothetical protein PAHAL_4G121900 [Panicum hallii]
MASLVPTPTMPERQQRQTTGTIIFSYTCVGLTGSALVAVLVFYCYNHSRRRAPVSAAGAGVEGNPGAGDHHHVGVDVTKLPEYAYTQSSRRRGNGGDGAQCSVCLGAVQPGEMVRRLPMCKHLYHVECIDLWLASHATCPICRSDVEPAADGQAEPTTTQPPQALPPV